MIKRTATILLDDVPGDNKCGYCTSDLHCRLGFNASPFAVYVHECPVCSREYVRILAFYDT